MTTTERYEFAAVGTYLVMLEIDMPIRGEGATIGDAQLEAASLVADDLEGGFLSDRLRESVDHTIKEVVFTGRFKDVEVNHFEMDS
jgi:hypothetical protein